MSDADYARLCDRTWNDPHLGDDFAFATETIGELYTVCFRGTKTWIEWVQDFFCAPLFPVPLARSRDNDIGPIHGGFLDGAEKLRPAVAALVAGRRFALVGHSLGGALATVLGGLLTVNGMPPVEIVTFGAPRAGMAPLRQVLKGLPIRPYIFGADPIPHVPPDPPFCHPHEPLLPLGKPLSSLLSNHHISNYIGALSDGPKADSLAA